MRIVAGRLKGRPFNAPPGDTTRPTSDRVREALFSILGGTLPPYNVLDAFAGSGALGIEALSRGAATATFVEKDKEALETLVDNLERLGVTERCNVLPMSIKDAIHLFIKRQMFFGLVFLDPPYDSDLLLPTLRGLLNSGVVQKGAIIVCEHRSDVSVDFEELKLLPRQTRKFGDTAISIADKKGW